MTTSTTLDHLRPPSTTLDHQRLRSPGRGPVPTIRLGHARVIPATANAALYLVAQGPGSYNYNFTGGPKYIIGLPILSVVGARLQW